MRIGYTGAMLLILLMGLIWWLFTTTPSQTQGHKQAHMVSDQTPVGGDFTLTGSHGTVSLHDFHGKVVLLYFGYTTCPDICPTNLSNLAAAMNRLPSQQQSQVQVIMITVDPQRDTQAKMDTYLPYFHPSFIGLTGSTTEIAAIAKRYGAVYQMVPLNDGALGYTVDHSAFTYLIDPQGKLIEQLPHNTSPEEFIAAIQPYLHP